MNLTFKPQLSNIEASCVAPGHLATTSKNLQKQITKNKH